eukprot:4181422-Alexandrium_andersonii.AAC.1
MMWQVVRERSRSPSGAGSRGVRALRGNRGAHRQRRGPRSRPGTPRPQARHLEASVEAWLPTCRRVQGRP